MSAPNTLSTSLTRNNECAHKQSAPSNLTNPLQHRPDLHQRAIAAPKPTWLERRFHRTFPETQYCHCPDCTTDHLIRHNLDLQLNHLECRPKQQQVLLEKVYRKVNYDLASGKAGYWKNQKEWKSYDQTAALIALSSYGHKEAFCNCGFHGYSCGDRLLCARDCFNLLAKPTLREFRRALRADNECYYIVVSLSREPDEKKRLIFKDLTKSEMQQIKLSGCTDPNSLDYGIPFEGVEPERESQVYWRIFQEVIHEFTGRGKLFSGAFGGPELAVRFLPLRVLPHANYVVWSPGLANDDMRLLRRALRNKLRGCRTIKPGLYPKLSVYRILANDGFRAVVNYMFKPIDVGFAYSVAANTVGRNRQALERLNLETDFFLENLPLAFAGVHRITRFGFCSASSSHYVGVVTAERLDRRNKDAERRKRRQARASEIRKHFPAYQPHRRKLTREHREDLHYMRAWYRRLVRDGELPGKPPKRWLKKRDLPHSGPICAACSSRNVRSDGDKEENAHPS